MRGRQVKVVLQDTTTSPSIAVQFLNQLISAHVQAVFGPTFTSECNALAPLIANGPVVSCFSPGVHPPAGSFMFSGGVGSDGMAHAIATYFRGRGWTKVAIISSTDASGQDFEENFDKALAEPVNGSLKLVAREHFATSDLSVAAQIARIKSAHPQALVVWTAGTGLGVALHGVHEVGLDVPIMAGNANMVREQLAGYRRLLAQDADVSRDPRDDAAREFSGGRESAAETVFRGLRKARSQTESARRALLGSDAPIARRVRGDWLERDGPINFVPGSLRSTRGTE